MRLLVVNRIGKDVENVIFHNYCGTTYSGLEVTDEFVRRLGLLYESRNEVNTLKNAFNTACYCASSGKNTVVKGKNSLGKIKHLERYLMGSADEYKTGQRSLQGIHQTLCNFDGSVVYIDWEFTADGKPNFKKTQIVWEELVNVSLLDSYSTVYPREAKKLKESHVDFKIKASQVHDMFVKVDRLAEAWKDGKYVIEQIIEE